MVVLDGGYPGGGYPEGGYPEGGCPEGGILGVVIRRGGYPRRWLSWGWLS